MAQLRRRGPLSDRIKVALMRSVMMTAWRLSERLGIDLAGATEGPRYSPDPERDHALAALTDAALAGDGTLDASSCPFPAHELLSYLVVARGFLLHGSNRADIQVLEPRPARDFRTELDAVVACDDGIWPIFYAVLDRSRGDANVFTACMHLGRARRLRRFYMFVLFHADPADRETWTRGVVYALRRNGFRREWGNEWVSPAPTRPVLRVLVGPEDFPLRSSVLAVAADDVRRINRRLREAKQARAA
jgi:hypothetical protein